VIEDLDYPLISKPKALDANLLAQQHLLVQQVKT